MFLILCIMFLSSCSSSAELYNQRLQNWVGMSQEALYHSWGYPNNEIYPSLNTKVVTYLKIEDNSIDDNTEPYAKEVNYDVIDTPDYELPPKNDTYYCKTSFTITNNLVVDYNFNGDDCIAEE